MAAFGSPRSPRPRRASSGPKSPALRPVILSEDAYDWSGDGMVEEEVEMGPAETRPHAGARMCEARLIAAGPAVDEVEAVFGD